MDEIRNEPGAREPEIETTDNRSGGEKAQNKPSRKLQLIRQAVTSLGPIMATVAIGSTFGYSAVLLPQLKPLTLNSTGVSWVENRREYSGEVITVNSVEEESWIAASATILMAPGCWLSGLLMEKIGRRKSQILIGPIYLVAWLVIGFAPNLWALISGRLLSGLCVGLQSPLGPVYVAETSEPRLRGLLLAGISLAIAVGILISHVLGTWLSWRVAAHLSSIFPTLCLLFSIFSPESPAWLARNNRLPEAADAWIYLRGSEPSSTAEFRALEESAKNGVKNTPENDSRSLSWKSPGFFKPLGILNAFFFTAQFSGVNVVAFYSVQIIANVSGPSGPKTAHYATLILDGIRVAASLAACWLTRRYPRRILAIISGAGSALSLLLLSASLVLDFGKPWLPAILLFVYTCAVCIGLVPLPWLLCGEIFPVALRGLGSGISSGFAFVCFFIVVKTGPVMIASLTNAGTFLFYGSVTAFGTIFLFFLLPETKDKTLKEIEENFAGKKRESEVKDERKDRGV